MLAWQKGRSGGGYLKFPLFDRHWPIRWDMVLLKIPSGCFIPPHTDPIGGMKHWRLNIVLRKPRKGGEFVAEKTILNLSRFKLFRPDLYSHSVTRVERGTRVCLSIGWALRKPVSECFSRDDGATHYDSF